jgi:hypothetical protein
MATITQPGTGATIRVGTELYFPQPGLGAYIYTVLGIAPDGSSVFLQNPDGSVDQVSSGSQLLNILKVLLPAPPATVSAGGVTFTLQGDGTYSVPATTELTSANLYALGLALVSALKAASGN